MEKNHKTAKQSCQIALFSSKSATESLKPVLFFVLICWFFHSRQWYRLYCKCVAALLTPRSKAKIPKVKTKQRIHEFLYFFLVKLFEQCSNSPVHSAVLHLCAASYKAAFCSQTEWENESRPTTIQNYSLPDPRHQELSPRTRHDVGGRTVV